MPKIKIKEPKNSNYCATVVDITSIIPITNCDNVVHTNIFGTLVIVSKDTKIGDRGLFFPPETQLSKEFLSNNNLYRHEYLNVDPTKKGYFEDTGRIRTVKFRKNPSMGFFLPLNSLDFIDHDWGNILKIGNEFDELDGVPICKKYIIKNQNKSGLGGQKKDKNKKKQVSKLIDGQFKFHSETSQLGKNLHQIEEDTIIDITEKLHGTSLVSSKVLCKRKLKWYEKVLKFCKVKIQDSEYDNLYSSRKVIKNDNFLNKNHQHYYNEDIWGQANNRLKDFLIDGMTIYAEIVGFLSTGAYIQKDYDYGCNSWNFDIYIYRITMTNPSGQVVEMPMSYVQDWCGHNGLKAVPLLYHGPALGIFEFVDDGHEINDDYDYDLTFQDNFLNKIKKDYLEMDCQICKLNKVPREGVVVRIDSMFLKAYKQKSFRFLEKETKNLDQGVEDIEEDQSINDEVEE